MSLGLFARIVFGGDVSLPADFWCKLARNGATLRVGPHLSRWRYNCKSLI